MLVPARMMASKAALLEVDLMAAEGWAAEGGAQPVLASTDEQRKRPPTPHEPGRSKTMGTRSSRRSGGRSCCAGTERSERAIVDLRNSGQISNEGHCTPSSV